MTTALDAYKFHYGMRNEPDGAVVLKCADNGVFFDNLLLHKITKKQLEDAGICAEMTREQLIDFLEFKKDRAEKGNVDDFLVSRLAIQRLVSFCTYDNPSLAKIDGTVEKDEKKQQSPLKETVDNITNRIDKHITNPLLDAIGRKIYTGSFFRKPKK